MAPSITYFAMKDPKLSLKETTVRRLKNLYQSTLKSKKSDHEEQELSYKKTGWPLPIEEVLDRQMQECQTCEEMWAGHKYLSCDRCWLWYDESRCKSIV